MKPTIESIKSKSAIFHCSDTNNNDGRTTNIQIVDAPIDVQLFNRNTISDEEDNDDII